MAVTKTGKSLFKGLVKRDVNGGKSARTNVAPEVHANGLRLFQGSIVKEEDSRLFSGSYYTFIRQRTCELWELFIFYVVQVIFKYDNGLRFSKNFLEMIFGKNSKSFEIYATRMEK